MKEQIIYRKVFIRGEEDLPKEDRMWYFGHTTDTNEIVRLRNKVHSDWNYIDWYFLPVPLPTDKEIKQWIKKDRQSLIDCEVATSGELMERFHGREEGVAWLKSRLTDK